MDQIRRDYNAGNDLGPGPVSRVLARTNSDFTKNVSLLQPSSLRYIRPRDTEKTGVSHATQEVLRSSLGVGGGNGVCRATFKVGDTSCAFWPDASISVKRPRAAQ